MRPFVLLLFFLSGACGLAYEVVWSRLLTSVFGTTAISLGTVLAAFVSGLAAGSWAFGGLADRVRSPLRLYAVLEIGVGLAALAAHYLLGQVTPAYLALNEAFGGARVLVGVARFVLAFALVMAPTMLMGATLPALTRHYVARLSGLGRGLSTLYAVNTAGALAGALATGFFLIRSLGLDRTVLVAAGVNLGIGLVAWLVSSRAPLAPPVPASAGAGEGPAASPVAPWTRRLLLLGLAVSGFTSFAYEVFWARSLVFLIGNSTYAVTTMLVAFLSGIALGGYLVRFLLDRVPDRIALFGWTQVVIGLASALALPALFALVDFHALRGQLGESSEHVLRVFATRFGVSLLVMLVPATVIGTTFPLVGRILVHELGRGGSSVGRIYALNALGNVLGALAPALVLLPLLGIQGGVVAMASLNVLVGVVALILRVRRAPGLRCALPAAVAAAVLVLTLAPAGFRFPAEGQGPQHRVLYYREGPSATTMVTVFPDTGALAMSVDGVQIGGTGFTDYKQRLLGHLPKLLRDDVSPELSIGLGSGILVGESARHVDVRAITCVEIEPSVVEGAALFSGVNRDVLADERLRIVVDDVANHLRTTRERYRVISADEKTGQEYASNGFSYSREYYELLRSRLLPGGIVVQWVPTTLPPRLYAMVLRTFSESFPHLMVWFFPPAFTPGAFNTILVGSEDDLAPALARLAQRLAAGERAFQGLSRYALTTPESILVNLVAFGPSVRGAVRDAAENTLDRPRYEFYSPSDFALPRFARLGANLRLLRDMRRAAAPQVVPLLVSAVSDAGRMERALAAEEEYMEGELIRVAMTSDEEMLRRYDRALALAPWNENLRGRVFLACYQISVDYLRRGNVRAADELMERALAVHKGSAIAHVDAGIIQGRLGRPDLALARLRTAVALEPGLPAARRVLARFLLRQGRSREAAEQLRALLRILPGDEAAEETLRGLEGRGR